MASKNVLTLHSFWSYFREAKNKTEKAKILRCSIVTIYSRSTSKPCFSAGQRFSLSEVNFTSQRQVIHGPGKNVGF